MNEGQLFHPGQRVRCIKDLTAIWSPVWKIPVLGEVYTVREYGFPTGLWLVEIVNPKSSAFKPHPKEPGFHQGSFAPWDDSVERQIEEIRQRMLAKSKEPEPA